MQTHKAPSTVWNHFPKRIHVTPLTSMYALFHRANGVWQRSSMVSYPYGFALRIWADKLVCSSNEYTIRAVDVKR